MSLATGGYLDMWSTPDAAGGGKHDQRLLLSPGAHVIDICSDYQEE